MREKFHVSYDADGDVLTIYRDAASVRESVEVSDELILDLDKNKKLVNLELLDAYKFLNTSNTEISKQMLSDISEMQLDVKNYRNYWMITLVFKYKDKIISEKLPAFASSTFQSPLIASAAS